MVYYGRPGRIIDHLQAKKHKAAVRAVFLKISFTLETEFRG
jgi:hypothetical protein